MIKTPLSTSHITHPGDRQYNSLDRILLSLKHMSATFASSFYPSFSMTLGNPHHLSGLSVTFCILFLQKNSKKLAIKNYNK